MIRSSSDVTRTLAIALIKAIELWRGQAEVLPQIDRHDHFYIQVREALARSLFLLLLTTTTNNNATHDYYY